LHRSLSGRTAPIRGRISPSRSAWNNSAQATVRCSAVPTKSGITGRVRNSEPLRPSKLISSGSMVPEDWPNTTRVPRGRRQSSEAAKVSRPTESYATPSLRPSVRSNTRGAMASRAVTMTCAQPFSRATAALSSVDTVPITRASA
jgi:hypothetical protein